MRNTVDSLRSLHLQYPRNHRRCYAHPVYSCHPKFPGYRDFLDKLRPTNTIGLSEDSNHNHNIRFYLFCWITGQSGRSRAMISREWTSAKPFIAGPRRPPPLLFPIPAVLTALAVIAAPSQADAAVESALGSPGTTALARPPRPSGRSRNGRVSPPSRRSWSASLAASSATSASPNVVAAVSKSPVFIHLHL